MKKKYWPLYKWRNTFQNLKYKASNWISNSWTLQVYMYVGYTWAQYNLDLSLETLQAMQANETQRRY